jgi:hypothetical protein
MSDAFLIEVADAAAGSASSSMFHIAHVTLATERSPWTSAPSIYV